MFASKLSVIAVLSIFVSLCVLGCTTDSILPGGTDGDQGAVDETPDQVVDPEDGDGDGYSTELTPPSDDFDIECEAGDGEENPDEGGDSTDASTNGEEPQDGDLTGDTLHIFHNGSGPMCLSALDWLADAKIDYPDLVVEEHMTTDSDERALMYELESTYEGSEGVSASFQYLPIIFFGDRAFSGFNDEVEAALAKLLESGS